MAKYIADPQAAPDDETPDVLSADGSVRFPFSPHPTMQKAEVRYAGITTTVKVPKEVAEQIYDAISSDEAARVLDQWVKTVKQGYPFNDRPNRTFATNPPSARPRRPRYESKSSKLIEKLITEGSSDWICALPKAKFPDAASLQKWYRTSVEQARAESGNDSYNGTISTTRGIQVTSLEFPGRRTAEEWLLANTQKWGPLKVVTVGANWIVGGWVAC